MDEITIDVTSMQKLKIVYNFTKSDGVYIKTISKYGSDHMVGQLTLEKQEMIELRDALNLILNQ